MKQFIDRPLTIDFEHLLETQSQRLNKMLCVFINKD